MLTRYRHQVATDPGDAPEYWARAIDAVLAASQMTSTSTSSSSSAGIGVRSANHRFARELVAIAWLYEAEGAH